MNLEELPWWGNKVYEEYKHNNSFFEFVSNDELSKRIKEFPLTKDLISSFLEGYISKIRFYNFNSNFKAIIYLVPNFNFEINMNLNYSLGSKASFLIHECAHGIYKVHGNSCEPILDKIELDFFNKNQLFCINLFKEFVKSKK